MSAGPTDAHPITKEQVPHSQYQRTYRILTGRTKHVQIPIATIAELLDLGIPAVDYLLCALYPRDHIDAIMQVTRNGCSRGQGSGQPLIHPTPAEDAS